MNNIETVKRFADLIEARDWNALQGLLADDFAAEGASLQLNKQQTIGYLQILLTAFPDHNFGLTDFEEKEGTVYCSSYETGTHTGILDLKPFGTPLSLPPTGRSFSLPKTMFTFRVADGKITYYGEEAVEGGGLAGMLAQLGVKPS